MQTDGASSPKVEYIPDPLPTSIGSTGLDFVCCKCGQAVDHVYLMGDGRVCPACFWRDESYVCEGMMFARFVLYRDVDETGISGVGEIAEGCQFSDGTCVLRWKSELKSTAVYGSLADLVAIHGHDGKTRVVWCLEGTNAA